MYAFFRICLHWMVCVCVCVCVCMCVFMYISTNGCGAEDHSEHAQTPSTCLQTHPPSISTTMNPKISWQYDCSYRFSSVGTRKPPKIYRSSFLKPLHFPGGALYPFLPLSFFLLFPPRTYEFSFQRYWRHQTKTQTPSLPFFFFLAVS